MAQEDLPGRIGRYEVVRKLGRGGMGIVYEGRDPNIGRHVAIKTARRDVLADSGDASVMLERFLREARAAGVLNHPNIVTIYDAGEESGLAYIAMEFVEGGDLYSWVDKRGGLTPEEAVEVIAPVCEALAYAHERGIVHRDIKPANILVSVDGRPCIADFGIAHVAGSQLTREGALVGTPHYMSPEQFTGRPVDGRTDLFAVAVMLYELLSGEKPFQGAAMTAVMHNVLKTNPLPLSDLNPAVNTVLSAVVSRALSKDPRRRYPDGSAMAKALRETLKENPDPAVTGITPFDEPTLEADTLGKSALSIHSSETMRTPSGSHPLDATKPLLQTPATSIRLDESTGSSYRHMRRRTGHPFLWRAVVLMALLGLVAAGLVYIQYPQNGFFQLMKTGFAGKSIHEIEFTVKDTGYPPQPLKVRLRLTDVSNEAKPQEPLFEQEINEILKYTLPENRTVTIAHYEVFRPDAPPEAKPIRYGDCLPQKHDDSISVPIELMASELLSPPAP